MYPKGTRFLKLSQFVVAVGHNILEVTGTPIHGCSLPQFLVPEGHKILEVTDDVILTIYRHLKTSNISGTLI